MLQVFRDHAHKWFVKVLLSLIVLSFGIWGIGDVIYKFFTNRPVVKVGKHSISREEVAHHLQKEGARIHEMTKGQVTAQQIKALGVHTAVVNRLVNQLVLTDELERLNLGISDDLLKDQIHSMPAFQTDGRFDGNKFLSMLQQQSMNERTFLKEARHSILNQQLMSSIVLGAGLPKFYQDILLDALTRERIFTLVEIDSSKMHLEHAVTQEQLESFYEQYRDKYTTPELRNITVVLLDVKAMCELLGITEENVRKAYNTHKDNLKFPERRDVKRLTYVQEDKALKAGALAKKGTSLAQIAKEIPGGEFEESGLIVKEQMPEFASKEVFSLKSGECTKVIPTGFGFHLFQVTKIEAPRVASFDEAKNELEILLIQEQKAGKMEEIRSQIDDSIAAGQTLNQVASKMKLKVKTFENINKNGITQDGKPIFDKPNTLQKAIIEKAFVVEEGLDSGFVDIPGEGAFILSVTKVSPSYTPKLNEIEARVRKDWEKEQRFDQASKLASTISSEAKSLDSLASLAKKHGCILTSNHVLSRLDLSKQGRKSADILPASLAEKAFVLTPNIATAGANAKGGFTVVMLQKVGDVKVTKEQKANIMNSMRNMVQEDVAAATMNAMKELHDIEINQEILAQMME
ncbi:MAG: SurA N-terminal domain-containing protein [Pseudomonadota bacterium]|jgi:peptidyl-prolyl cis-trans isomerase D|nr:SurA N-terminal domain-containing protein [Alphaproteobacteria bacterium]